MKVYGYVRISRDEDNKKESIETQRKVVEEFGKEQGYDLIRTFEDNNVSGYTFERPALAELKELIEANEVDVLIAKDLSRIGRHNAKTLLFLDYLDEHKVRLLLKNDNYDSKNDDDTIIGIKTWYNEMYLKDLSRKIKTNMRQKQKEGLVIVPSFGYMKDLNNPKKFMIDEDAAETVKLIYKLYIEGYGVRKIANYLNANKIETPAMRKKEKFGFGGMPTWDYKELWYETSVRRILHNDVYTGTLRCGVTKLQRMKGKKMTVPKEEHIVHENYFEPIISKEDFELVDKLAKNRKNHNVRAKNEKIHKYAGILKCESCDKGFVARKHKTKTIGDRITYVCATFHRYGTKYCTGHRVFESDLDDIIFEEIEMLIKNASINIKKIDENIENRKTKRKDYEDKVNKVEIEIHKKKEEIKNYSKQIAKGLIDEELFEELVKEAKEDLEKLKAKLKGIEEIKENIANEKENILKCIDLLLKMREKKDLTNSDINLLIEKIIIKETDEVGKYNCPKLEIEIKWNTKFIYIKDIG